MKDVLRNCWYLAAWGSEIGDQPLGRRILGIPVVLFRDEQSAISALLDTCPHRFARLSKGRVVVGTIQCPYHGLRFNRQGACVEVPVRAQKDVPDLRTDAFPVVEDDGFVWIWMGDSARAESTPLPDMSFLRPTPYVELLRLYMHQKANFFLGVDNLMDPSHTAFAHRATIGQGTDYLADLFGQAAYACPKYEGGRIGSEWTFAGPDGRHIPGQTFEAIWYAPSTVIQRSRSPLILGETPRDGVYQHFAHFLTPETEHTAHYFAIDTYDRRDKDDTYLAERETLLKEMVFLAEDDPILSDIDSYMAGAELFSLKPAILPADVAAVTVRRSYARMLKAEAAGQAVEEALEPIDA